MNCDNNFSINKKIELNKNPDNKSEFNKLKNQYIFSNLDIVIGENFEILINNKILKEKE